MSISIFPGSCSHHRFDVGPYEADLCPVDRSITWFDGDDEVDPDAAVARLFGSARLVTVLPGLRAPGSTVLVYRPVGAASRAWMNSLPPHEWFEAVPGMYVGHDGDNLTLCPVDPLVVSNLLARS